MDDLQDIFIYNALDKEVHTKAFGNHFTFKPKQVKRMRGEIGRFLDSTKGYMGLIAVSDSFEDPAYATTEAGQAELEQKTQEGVQRHINYLQSIVDNLQVNLRRDLDTKNIKADVAAFATDGELEAIDELLGYQRHQQDAAKLRMERARVGLRRVQASQTALANTQAKEPKE